MEDIWLGSLLYRRPASRPVSYIALSEKDDKTLVADGWGPADTPFSCANCATFFEFCESAPDRAEALVLAEALTVDGCTLKLLNLGTNELGDVGATHLAQALPRSRSLKTLDLSRNQIGATGGKALAGAIKSRQESGIALDTCFLWRNNLSDKVKAAMPKGVKV